MPRSGAPHPARALSSRGRGYNHLSAEEAAGIAILVIVIVLLLIIGCWYCKKRRGYQVIKNHFGPATVRALMGSYCEKVAPMDIKVPLQEYSNLSLGPVVPDAPPAYSEIDIRSLPPSYSP
uniref:Melanoma antigen recognized by T-cells 1 isoform X2 n=1 Tax=Geotrypetes seraphini TaxID=260995 RepID=A0A6P8NYK8_GEOSA|nr:melanoma antigen recognized by T-cells 1 isoform X2 [Geotrypetes seraphini]XP_033781593.1 melanoma antigen recognized by T-cells 1 isoform X2 [Geotrypetes seraphini]XP_033781594.1 melanoma antigen recognized by T-cells 1 isoform X2 [Geotrypetes seraphini]XP_033781603.1 melanoma antigen recognized by T-cells 1 isoform X2 [Geotrypetes seraphini]XP_033781612.1 melanoma antigen recognized by T-cells 1 isoform X2 [Geotrypetes seraphini]XP_033781619.1 melanoma antigen recognized by T-cells 1 isof